MLGVFENCWISNLESSEACQQDSVMDEVKEVRTIFVTDSVLV